MIDKSEDLKFNAMDTVSGTPNLINSTLALINNSNLPNEQVRRNVTNVLENIVIDFHSDDPDVPRELPALYETGEQGTNHCFIYAPRNGKIDNVSLKPSATGIRYNGRNAQWETFVTKDADYSILVE